MFRGSVKGTGYPLYSPVSPSLSLPCVTVCHHISTGLYRSFSSLCNFDPKKLLGKFLLYSTAWNTWNFSCIWKRFLWFGVFVSQGRTYVEIDYDVMGKNSACGCTPTANCSSKWTMRPDSPRSFTVCLTGKSGCNLILRWTWIFTPGSRGG
jgi:hypothetical protein